MNPGQPHYPEAGTMLMGLPFRWYDAIEPMTRCQNGHVHRLHSVENHPLPNGPFPTQIEALHCPTCGENLELTYPEDHEPIADD